MLVYLVSLHQRVQHCEGHSTAHTAVASPVVAAFAAAVVAVAVVDRRDHLDRAAVADAVR